MTLRRFIRPRHQEFDEAGNPIPGAQYWFYASGTSTPKNTYSDRNLTIAHANPVVADNSGRFPDIFLEDGEYKVVLKNADGFTYFTADPVQRGVAATAYAESLLDADTAAEAQTILGVPAAAGTILTTFVRASGILTPAQITTSQDNYNPSGIDVAFRVRLNASTPVNLTGLAGGAEGRLVTLQNVGASAITLVDESVSSDAANRFALVGNIVLNADQTALLQYDALLSRWVSLASPTPAAVSPIVAGTPLVLNPFALNQNVTQAHGLGVTPAMVTLVFECLTIDGGQAVGTKFMAAPTVTNASGVTSHATIVDATNVVLRTHQSIAPSLMDTTNGTLAITPARWKLTVTPYRIS